MSPPAPPPEDGARAIADFLKVFAHPGRLRLLFRLSEGECAVAEMERELGIRQPSLSQYLGELREAGLVSTRREHKTVFYRLTEPRAAELVAVLHGMFGLPGPERGRPVVRGRHAGAAMFAWTDEASAPNADGHHPTPPGR